MVPVYVEKSGSGLVRVLDSHGQVFAGFLETRYITTVHTYDGLDFFSKMHHT